MLVNSELQKCWVKFLITGLYILKIATICLVNAHVFQTVGISLKHKS